MDNYETLYQHLRKSVAEDSYKPTVQAKILVLLDIIHAMGGTLPDVLVLLYGDPTIPEAEQWKGIGHLIKTDKPKRGKNIGYNG